MICPGADRRALYPREDEEYPWIISRAGFRTYLVSGSILHHPRPATGLVRVELAGKAFYYEPGLDARRLYYKVRNWAWLQRLKHPDSPPLQMGGVRRIRRLVRSAHRSI